MVGQGVIRECLRSSEVTSVLIIGRASAGILDSKVRELLRPDLYDCAGLEQDLAGYDACFFCLGVSSAGMKEADYTHVTYDLTLAVAKTLLAINPALAFVYVSGLGTDATGMGSTMWARVKGRTENALLNLGFSRAFMFRPGFIQPLGGIKSRTRSYRVLYALARPVFPMVRALAPGQLTDTARLGRAMISVVKHGYPKTVLGTKDINAAASSSA